MANPMSLAANPDVLNRNYSKIFFSAKQHEEEKSMLPQFFTVKKGRRGADERQSQFGTFDNWGEFSGTVDYQSAYQGYDVTATYKHFVSGFQVDSTYSEDDLFGVVANYPAEMALAGVRTKETHASRILNLMNSNDIEFYNHSEGVPLVSNSHTTTASGVSTASGFDNLTTAALSLTSVIAMRIQMRNFLGDRGNKIHVEPDELWYPVDLCADAYEIVESMGRPDNANNAKNYMFGKLSLKEWLYMSDANNYALCDSGLRKQSVQWFDHIPFEFARAEDLDTIVMKYRGRTRYSFMYRDWRYICGAIVS